MTYGLDKELLKNARLNMRWGCHHDDQMARLKAVYEDRLKSYREGRMYSLWKALYS